MVVARGAGVADLSEEVAVAGHRRRAGRPTRAQARFDRRRHLLVSRLGRAHGAAERLAVAYGYARAVLVDLGPRGADALAAELVEVLVTTAERAAQRTVRAGRRSR